MSESWPGCGWSDQHEKSQIIFALYCQKVIIYASDSVFLEAVRAEENGGKELPVLPMNLAVLRHENLAAYSVEPLGSSLSGTGGWSAADTQLNPMNQAMNRTEASKANTNGML